MSSTTQASFSTPTKAPPAPVPDSPGTWHHPRLQEITQRQEACNFTEKNAKRISYNAAFFFAVVGVFAAFQRLLSIKRVSPYTNYIYWLLLALPILNICANLLPLLRPKDELVDIPLTPGQRRLLGLPASPAPPTPGSVYSTPPRYSRTPSVSGSAASRRSFSTSPVSNHSPSSNHGSPAAGGSGGGGGLFASPAGNALLQKAVSGAQRRSSLGAMGSPSPLGVSTSSSLFGGGGPESPSPSPSAGGKRSTVGLSSKWRYDKGMVDKGWDRRESGNGWMYT
ncbi:nuclear pore complex component-domain-containing protein [Xylariaceae sp. FL0804]|nr:nuclear pore complex component-domain-containing protein [Xylariaceae sp. FL0804]